ncbi:MAG: hypothetical protein QF440_06745 [Candidatus Thalassarchaeaceae archaeon]|jgi:hypothetical protein|nr:hypothetical protein [Candidatus Thalassarchaeaceae archaeon]
MWVWFCITFILILLGLLIRQRWKVTAEWIRKEKELSEEEYAMWCREQERKSEAWSERMKGVETAFILLLSAAMLGLWFMI